MDPELLKIRLGRNCYIVKNDYVSDMLHTSKDFAKCKALMKERSNLYNGAIVQIDLSATSLDLILDLSNLAS